MSPSLRLHTLAIPFALGCALVVGPIAQAHWDPPHDHPHHHRPVVHPHHRPIVHAHHSWSSHASYHTNVSERVYDSAWSRYLHEDTNVLDDDTTFVEDAPRNRPTATGRDLWILSVGVNCKRLAPGSLPDNDAPFARQFAHLLQQHRKPLYDHVQTRLLTGHQATRQNILAGFHWLETHARPGDVSVVYLSGHGSAWSGNYFMLPAFEGHQGWQKKVLWGQEIREALLEIPGQKVLLLGTCTAGSILKTPIDTHGLPKTEIICSTRAHEVAGPSFAMDHALIRGLQGAAANREGIVTVGSLVHYLQTQVQRVTHDKQHLTVIGPPHQGTKSAASVFSLAHLPLGA